MKIVHLIDYFQPKVGYQETFLAREHGKAGHDVWVVTSDRYFPFPDYKDSYFPLLGDRIVRVGKKIEDGISTVRLRSTEIPGTNMIYLSGLKGKLTEIAPDTVFCHGMYSFTSYLVARIKAKRGFRLIYDNHAAAFNTKFNSFPKRIYRFFFSKFAAPVIKSQADAIFAIGEAERDFACSEFGLKNKEVSIIRLGVDTKLFSPDDNKRKIMRKKLDVSDHDIVLVFSGKISPRKDIEILLQAAKKINDTKIRVLLVGGGEKNYISGLKQILNYNQLIVETMVSNDKLPDYYNTADIAVWPGDPSQGMLEAMSTGLPLIIPKWFGTQYLTQSRGSLFFPRKNIAQLAQKVAQLSYNKRLRQETGRAARSHIRRYFGWQEIARQALSLVQK